MKWGRQGAFVSVASGRVGSGPWRWDLFLFLINLPIVLCVFSNLGELLKAVGLLPALPGSEISLRAAGRDKEK